MRSIDAMQLTVTDVTCSGVCVSVTRMCPAKMAEPIEMLFGQ